MGAWPGTGAGSGAPEALLAAGRGAAVGLWLASLSMLVSALLPYGLAREPLMGWHVVAYAELMAAYATAGALVGVAGARLLRKLQPGGADLAPLLVQGVLLALWILHLLALPQRGPRIAALCVAAACLGALLLLALAVPAARRRLGWMRHAWLTWGALVAGGWLGCVHWAGASALVGALVCAAPALLLGLLASARPGPEVGRWRPERPWVALAAAGVLLVLSVLLMRRPGALPAGASGAPPTRGPNVVLLVLDTVRADHLSLYGYERATTPGLERIAAHATVYEQAYAPGDMTLSSHASLFTGLWPRAHGAHFDERGHPQPLAARFETLAELLARAGWRTAGVAANHVFFGQGHGLEQGFELLRVEEPASQQLERVERGLPAFLPGRALIRWTRLRLGPVEAERDYQSAGHIDRKATDLLEELASGEAPFFLFVNFMDAHWPYMPPASHQARFGAAQRISESDHYAIVHQVVRDQARALTPEERAALNAMYDEALAYLDLIVERFVARLDELGLAGDTLLVITSDHGEALGEHGLVGHAVSVHQHQVRVPLIVRLPGQRDGARASRSASLVDLVPTVLHAAGLELPAGLHGVPLQLPAGASERDVVAESYPNPGLLGARFEGTERALLRGELKLILPRSGPARLYDPVRDPGELADLAGDLPRAGLLAAALQAWLETTVPPAPTRGSTDARALERLRLFGYAR